MLLDYSRQSMAKGVLNRAPFIFEEASAISHRKELS